MSLFGNIFGENTKEESSVTPHWVLLETSQQLQGIISNTKNEYLLIFKHSTRCGISRNMLSKFEKATDFTTKNVTFYYLDLLNYRNISNAIAEKLEVTHQSPQLLLVKNGKVLTHQSHYDIVSDFKLEDFI